LFEASDFAVASQLKSAKYFLDEIRKYLDKQDEKERTD